MVWGILCALMWALTLVLLAFRWRRRDKSALYGTASFAVTLTLGAEGIYQPVDQLLGSMNILHLVVSTGIMVAVFFYAKGVVRVHPKRIRTPIDSPILLLLFVLAATITFFMIPQGGESTHLFMEVHGGHVAAAVYSNVMYLYLAVIIIRLGGSAARTALSHEGVPGREKAAAVFLATGSMVALTLCVTSVYRRVCDATTADLIGCNSVDHDVIHPLQIAANILLFLGLTVAPVGAWLSRRRRARETQTHLRAVSKLWERAGGTCAAPFLADDPPAKLHRQIVEVRDAAFRHDIDFTLSRADRRILAAAEAHLLDVP